MPFCTTDDGSCYVLLGAVQLFFAGWFGVELWKQRRDHLRGDNVEQSANVAFKVRGGSRHERYSNPVDMLFSSPSTAPSNDKSSHQGTFGSMFEDQSSSSRSQKRRTSERQLMILLLLLASLFSGAASMFLAKSATLSHYNKDHPMHPWNALHVLLYSFYSFFHVASFGMFLIAKMLIVQHMIGLARISESGVEKALKSMRKFGVGSKLCTVCLLSVMFLLVSFEIANLRSWSSTHESRKAKTAFRLNGNRLYVEAGALSFAGMVMLYWMWRLAAAGRHSDVPGIKDKVKKAEMACGFIFLLLLLRSIASAFRGVAFSGLAVERSLHRVSAFHQLCDNIAFGSLQGVYVAFTILGEPIAGLLGYYSLGKGELH